MKFLILSDLHHFLYKELEMIKDLNYDICILLGDIKFEYLKMIKNIINTNIYGVYGNHDKEGNFDELKIINLHMNRINLYKNNCNLNIAGFQGSCKYKENFSMYTQEESIDLCKKIEHADILFTHDSPFGLYDDNILSSHCGLKGITQYIKKRKPKYVIHGHHHVNEKIKIKKNNVICIYRCVVFDYKTGNINHIF